MDKEIRVGPNQLTRKELAGLHELVDGNPRPIWLEWEDWYEWYDDCAPEEADYITQKGMDALREHLLALGRSVRNSWEIMQLVERLGEVTFDQFLEELEIPQGWEGVTKGLLVSKLNDLVFIRHLEHFPPVWRAARLDRDECARCGKALVVRPWVGLYHLPDVRLPVVAYPLCGACISKSPTPEDWWISREKVPRTPRSLWDAPYGIRLHNTWWDVSEPSSPNVYRLRRSRSIRRTFYFG